MAAASTDGRATPKQVKEFFGCSLADLKALKESPSTAGNANAYDDIALGIGNGTYTY